MRKTKLLILVVAATVLFASCGTYNDWSREQKMKDATNEGAALLAHSTNAKEVAVSEARAKLEAAQLLAAADTVRAHGVARSNEIIGESLRDNQSYLHWLWIDNIEKNPNAVIYIPTEANLPILEAGKNRLPH